LLVVLGLALVAPSLSTRLVLDDYTLLLCQRDPSELEGFPYRPFDMFRMHASEAENRARMGVGALLPWWTDEHLLLTALRPISSATHVVDFRLWPTSPVFMQLHTLGWYALLLVVVSRVYRRLSGSDVTSGLALFLYVIDDTHGPTLSWIANRNAIIAAALGMLALIAHDRWRREGWRFGPFVAPIVLLLAVLSCEVALGVVGYLVAYALFVDGAPVRSRVGSMLPYLVTIGGWAFTYRALGYGAHGSDVYHDPIHEPFAFAVSAGRNASLLLMGQFSVPGSDLWAFARSADAGIVAAMAVVTVATGIAVIWPFFRRDPKARFWVTGMLLALVPIGAAIPGDRLLMLVSVGAMGLLAHVFVALIEGRAPLPKSRILAGAMLIPIFAVALRRVALAPLLLPLRSRTMEMLGRIVDKAEASIPMSPEVRDKHVILISTPTTLLASYVQVMRAARRTPRPSRLRWLTAGSDAVTAYRVSDRALRVRPDGGYFADLPERLYRGPGRPLHRGDAVDLGDMVAEVVEVTADGRPWEIEFRFQAPLESSSYVWLQWKGDRYAPWSPPALGERSTLPGVELMKLMAEPH
jgi:hypothetical protein